MSAVGIGSSFDDPTTENDRGGRQAPVAADFAGIRLEVGAPYQVEVAVPPYEEDWAIRIRERARPSDDQRSA